MTGEEQQMQLVDEHNQLLSDFRKVTNTAEGQRLVKMLINQCNILEPLPFDNNVSTAYFEGKRSIGLGLLELVKQTQNNQLLLDIIRGNNE